MLGKNRICYMDADTKQALEALLSAFRDWSLTSDARTKVLPSIQERLTIMEDRLTKVELKILERGN